jgi:uncharacterized protein (UPF0335 family)
MSETTITLEVPGMEPVTTTLEGMKRAAAYLKTPAGRKATREMAGREELSGQTALDDHPVFQKAAQDATNLFQTKSVAADQLKAFIERVERLTEELDGVKEDVKSVYAEAKGQGFDTKVLRKVIAIRKRDYAERQEEEAVLELYMQALGMIG